MTRGLKAVCGLWAGLWAAGLAAAQAPTPPDWSGKVCTPSAESGGAGRDMQAALDSAIDAIARERGVEPARKRSLLLAALARSQACYASDLTEEQIVEILRRTSALPPGLDARGLRFETETRAWLGEATITEAGSGRGARLTYSFPADGTSWGSACSGINFILPSALDASLVQTFGSLDRGREYVRSAIASYRRVAGLTYAEVPDDGTPMTLSTAREPTRGDIRIGGIPLGSPTFQPLAYNAFPQGQSVSTCAGGDMVINTSAFAGTSFLGATNFDRRYFRNCIAHEHGHGLGLVHTVPCNGQKLMEPFIYASRELLGNDDIRGVQRNYGDRYAGNNSQNAARDFGNLTTPSLRSVIERDLSINGTGVVINGLLVSTDDWFRFTLDSAQTVSVTVAPTGATVPAGTTCSGSTLDPVPCVGRQASGCTGTVGLVNASQAGNLATELRDATGLTVIDSAGSAPAGSSETFTRALGAGTYLLRVQDVGGTVPGNQTLQTYDLTIRVGTALAPPVALAGLDKLATAGQLTTFIGNHHSRAMEPGATIPTANYAWDLDGNGSLELQGPGQTQTTYVSNGTYAVTLRVTDSNGRTARDTIIVTVRGATTSLTSATPAALGRGLTTPVLIRGTNLKGVASASQIVVAGSGVSVTGTPVVNGMGTEISGLSLVVAPGAATGNRSVSVSNADGLNAGANATAGQLVTVVDRPANDECVAATQLGSGLGPYAYTTEGSSVSAAAPCPSVAGSDVWLAWTAPATGTLTATLQTDFGFALAAYASAACPPGAALACAESGPVIIPVQSGGVYLFRVATDAEGQTAPGLLLLSLSIAPGACCAADGSCSLVVPASCTGTFVGGATCSGVACPQPAQACCAAAGSCTLADSAACASSGGTAQGPGSVCSPNPCPQPSAACCRGSTCEVLAPSLCVSPGPGIGALTASGACNPPGVSVGACCLADFDKAGGRTVGDIFAYLSAWFAGSSYASIQSNGAATPTVGDIFGFLSAWFAGCP